LICSWVSGLKLALRMVRTKLWMKLLIMRCRFVSSSTPPCPAACLSLCVCACVCVCVCHTCVCGVSYMCACVLFVSQSMFDRMGEGEVLPGAGPG
jgi:hypothetical protein